MAYQTPPLSRRVSLLGEGGIKCVMPWAGLTASMVNRLGHTAVVMAAARDHVLHSIGYMSIS